MKTTRTVLVILAIIIILPFLGYLLWIIQKDQPLDLMIVNKSVANVHSNEVKAFNWVLNYKKIVKSTRSTYDYTRDYYGFFPDPVYEGDYIKSFKLEEIPALIEQYDGLIFLDNAGVESKALGNGKAAFYGGFNQNDYLLLREMYSKNKLIVAENNFFSEPTEDLVRYNTEQLLDVYYLHWKGKLFKNLDQKKVEDEIGKKWIDVYTQTNNSSWDLEGPGLILLNNKQSRILVLPQSTYMVSDYPTINTDEELASFYSLPLSVPYDGWFQVVYEGKNQVISYFNLQLNEAGREVLKSGGLDYIFPATIALNSDHHYFLAGDFSKQDVMLTCSKSRLLSGSLSSFCKLIEGSPAPFFQNYYVPFMSTILENYLNGKDDQADL